MKKWLFGIIGISFLAWLVSIDITAFANATSFFGIRRNIVLLTGIVTFALMGFAMILALRLPVLERLTGGLDQSYHVHKWAGISAGIFLLAHYLTIDAPKWLTRAGLMTRPPRGDGPRPPENIVTLPGLKDLAEGLGEWLLYIIPALLVVALIRLIPWRAFHYAHKLFPVLFLGGAFHSVALMPVSWWTQPAGVWTAVWVVAGTLAAVWSLAGWIGQRRQYQGKITAIHFIPDAKITEVDIDLSDRPMPHKAGQFAFLRFNATGDAHPFTIASADPAGRHVRFAIKTLGDFTRRLPDLAQPGQAVRVEGPYGRFTFTGTRPQVWVAGGIGITPFLSRLDALAQAGGAEQPITLHYCVADRNAALWPEDLAARCEAAGVDLQVRVAERGEMLNASALADQRSAGNWPDIWFCGPKSFADALKAGLSSLGLPLRQFHAEKFQMR